VTDPSSPTSVDLDQLQHTADLLDQISEFVQTHCLDAMAPVHDALGAVTNVHLPQTPYKFTRQATFFGGFYSAYGLQASHDNIFRAVQESLTNIATDLKQTAEATRTMMANYRTIEEANTAIADDIRRILAGPDPAGSDGSGGSAVFDGGGDPAVFDYRTGPA